MRSAEACRPERRLTLQGRVILAKTPRSTMNRHMLIISNAFYVASGALALPSVPGFLYFGWVALRMRMLPSPPSTEAAASPDSLIGLLELGARAFGSIFRAVGAAGQWLTTVLAVVFLLALLLSGGLFFTGRGLQAHAGWARMMAILFALGMMLLSLVAMVVARRGIFPLFASVAAGCVYAIWIMLRRFA